MWQWVWSRSGGGGRGDFGDFVVVAVLSLDLSQKSVMGDIFERERSVVAEVLRRNCYRRWRRCRLLSLNLAGPFTDREFFRTVSSGE